MATPRSSTYSVETGLGVYAGVDAPYPAWVERSVSGEWSVVPMAKKLSDINPMNDASINPEGVGGPAEWAIDAGRWVRIITSWNGWGWNEEADEAWMLHCGGHTDYGGNEVLACDFFNDEPEWRMVRKPSGAIGNLLTTRDSQEASGVYSDGRPRSTHTYNLQIYIPGVGPVVIGCPGPWFSGVATKKWAIIVNETTGEPTYTDEMSVISNDNIFGGGAVYHPTRNCVYLAHKGNNQLVKIVPGTGNNWQNCTASLVGSAISKGASASLTLLPDDDCLLIGYSSAAGTHGGWYVFDCATNTATSPTFSGSLPSGFSGGETQPCWVDELGAVCGWDNTNGSTTQIARLTPGADVRSSTWTIDTLTVAGTNSVTPTAKTTNGTFGRFRYSQRLRGFLLNNAVGGDTYYFRI